MTIRVADWPVTLGFEAGTEAARARLLDRYAAFVVAADPEAPPLLIRQEPGPERRFIDADRLGRFVVEDICAGPTSLTCHRAGERPVTTDWTSL